jgi:hypothetical protein
MHHVRSAIARFGLATLLAAVASGPALADDPPVLKILPTGIEAGEAPFLAQVPDTLKPGKITLRRLGDGKTFEGTVFVGGTPTYLAVVLDRLPKDDADNYQLSASTPFQTVDLTGKVEVDVKGPDEKLEARLIADKATKPYIFPLIGPTGERYTRAYPMEQVEGEDHDHPHQRSCWFTFGHVNGVDFWAELPGHGTIEQNRHQKVGAGAAQVFASNDEWKTPDGKTIMTDDRRIIFWKTEKVRIIDFDVTLHASHGPVTFGDTKEGMFGVRVASTMDVNRKMGGKITNAEGITDGDAWGKASPWVDYTGPVAGKTVGIAILNRPDSFRYPTTWHVRDYGLFAANPFGYHDFGRKETGEYTLSQGESLHFSYRMILHEGTTDEADIPAAFKLYAEPPMMEISGLPSK